MCLSSQANFRLHSFDRGSQNQDSNFADKGSAQEVFAYLKKGRDKPDFDSNLEEDVGEDMRQE